MALRLNICVQVCLFMRLNFDATHNVFRPKIKRQKQAQPSMGRKKQELKQKQQQKSLPHSKRCYHRLGLCCYPRPYLTSSPFSPLFFSPVQSERATLYMCVAMFVLASSVPSTKIFEFLLHAGNERCSKFSTFYPIFNLTNIKLFFRLL